MKSQEEEFENWNVLIRKATVAEAKTWRRSASQIKEVDHHGSQGHYPSLQANKLHQQAMGQVQGPLKDTL